MIRLSVVIPGYNTPEAWWRRCVDSVKQALGPDDEIILVDDGSLDGARFLDAWGCRVIHKQNGGLASARNAGMAVAQGEFMTFVDSDDEVMPDVFERCLTQIRKTESDVCIYGVRTVWIGDGLQKVDACEERAYGRLTPLEIHDLSRRCLMNYACNKVYRADFLRQNNIAFDSEGMPNEDIMFNLECVLHGAMWCSVSTVGYVYYRTHGTLLSRYKPTNYCGYENCAKVWRRLLVAAPDCAGSDRDWIARNSQISTQGLDVLEWNNIWMPGTPYSLWQRVEWLKKHPSVGGRLLFMKKMLFVWFRRHFYFRPVRRWHIRRLYPQVKEFVSEDYR